jgi:hypothetical protein
VATPFVQGRLLEKELGCEVVTECVISGRPIVFDLDSELRYSVRPPAEGPMFFIPMVDLLNLDSPCIVDDF